ncbi:hypothetical protein BGW80DRAFT_1453793 [Lactifluus volemus]|nr:hypothetical protein BGW80DRAFT_1453793 [Lactifluus volemus]
MPVVDASSSPTSTSTVPGIPTSFTAPLLFGPLFNWALYGVLLVQIYVYSYNFPDDRRYLKFLVYLVFFLDTAQTVLTGLDAYHWFVDGLNNLEFLTRPWFSHVDIPILSGFVALIVQMFLCSRIWILNKRLWWLCIVISFFSLAQAAGAFWAGFKNLSLKSGGVIKPSIYLWFGSSVLTDVLIAVAMVFLLIQRRDNKNQFSSYVLPRVVRLIVETNVLTTTVAIITFILFVAFPNKYYFLVPDTVIGKL